MSKNLVFAGSPEFAAFHLQALIANDLTPSAVFTQPDRPAGRGRKLTANPVKQLAADNQLNIFQFPTLDESAKSEILALPQPQLLIVVAYGLLLPEWLLHWPKYGAINVHASLLPRWRGAAPIQRAIEAGDKDSGVGIMQMEKGLDTGAVWLEKRCPIDDSTNAAELYETLKTLGATALIEFLQSEKYIAGKPTPQAEDGVTYAQKLSKAEAKINWHDSMAVIERKIRAFNPVPVAFTQIGEQRYRIYSASPEASSSDKAVGTVIAEDKNGIVVRCSDGAICIHELQEIGKKRLTAKDFLNAKSLLGVTFES